ncbi:MAG: nitroreductase family protein [Bacteroidales bacterium]|nr:nitroreductase family protein [Bacteroidales bacterium]
MSFIELAKKRQSERNFMNFPVEKEKIERCLDAARIAPSASNSQPWTFVVINEPELREKVARETYSSLMAFNKFVHQAGAIIVIVMEKPSLITQIGGKIKNKEFSLIDIGIAAEHFCLQATEEGLGTCMLGWFNEEPIKSVLKIPRRKTIGLLIALGYSANQKLKEKKRKDMDEFRKYNTYK